MTQSKKSLLSADRGRIKRLSRVADVNELIADIKGDKYREYRRLFEASKAGEIQLEFPVDMSIETMDFCNYACPYCPRVAEPGDGTAIRDDVFQSLIDEYAKKTGGMAAVGFDRGEPLLDKKLEEKIAYIERKGIQDIILTTNGVYLTKSRGRKLIEAGITKLHISLDAATQETYSKTRGGTLAEVEENIRALLNSRDEMNSALPFVRVSFVVNELNEHEVELFHQKWGGVVDYVDFQNCFDNSYLNDISEFEVESIDCYYPSNSVSVNAKGEISPCCSFYNKYLNMGSAGENDAIERAFNSDLARDLRRSFKEQLDFHLICKNCMGKPANIERPYKPLIQPAAGAPKGRPKS